ncbi:mevalonate kinase [Sulfodiicoccus acidiphilus]|uniref:Mevalonate kinase n=1 Tax=Sulfodiicoccus acidiphilus TaxID=1670455 RepID=A0A348B0G0_9CREN|nr:mevalonate kinase [Sulfodiicoccus acidiphilus]BBD71662.1 mevalonate kinase [Sulfodiicoccus acidiphilus]GGT86773.1 mevalonate kinase [Sulfodiicoccus acidiphilus]
MNSVVAKVPLKLTLFGEHAVVYKRPALAFTTSESLTVKVKESSKFLLKSDSLRFTGASVDLDSLTLESPEAGRLVEYVVATLKHFHVKRPLEVEIQSTVEPSVGMGTSAAVVVGMVAALSHYLGFNFSKDEIARTSYEIELEVQGLGSKMDTFTETIGGIIYFRRDGTYEVLPERKIPIVAGYMPRTTTTKQLLHKVKSLMEREPKLFNDLMELMGNVTERAKDLIVKEDYENLSLLAPFSHGLLSALGVTNSSIDEFVSRAKELGVGCKVSGGGAGGSLLCVTKDPYSSLQAKSLLLSFGAKIVDSNPTFTGVYTSFI